MPDPDSPEPAEPVTLAVVPRPPVELAPVELAHRRRAAAERVRAGRRAAARRAPPIELAPVELPPDLNAAVEPAIEPVLEVAEPWLAEPELPPAPVAGPGVTVHPPVPAAELPPLAAPEKKRHSGRKSFPSRASPRPRRPRRPRSRRCASRRRRVRRSGRRSSRSDASRRSLPPKRPTAQLPAAAKTPLLKKKLSLPSLSLPKLPSRGGGKSGPHREEARRSQDRRVAACRGARLEQRCRRAPAARSRSARRRRRRGGELRDPEALGDALKVFFAKNKLPKKGVRLGIASNRIGVRIFDIVGVEEEKQLRERGALPRAGGAADPARRGCARLPRARRVGRRRRTEGQAGPARRRLPRARRALRQRVQEGRHPARRHRPRGVRAAARARCACRPRGSALVAVAIGHDRSTFAVSDGRVCEFTRVARVGRLGVERRARSRVRQHSVRGRGDQAQPLARRQHDP